MGGGAVLEGKQEESSEDPISMMPETFPVGLPSASSSEATKDVPAANGRKVTADPVLVTGSQELASMDMNRGLVELKGTTVKVSGRATGAWQPLKVTLKDPHCAIEEKVTALNAKAPSDR